MSPEDRQFLLNLIGSYSPIEGIQEVRERAVGLLNGALDEIALDRNVDPEFRLVSAIKQLAADAALAAIPVTAASDFSAGCAATPSASRSFVTSDASASQPLSPASPSPTYPAGQTPPQVPAASGPARKKPSLKAKKKPPAKRPPARRKPARSSSRS